MQDNPFDFCLRLPQSNAMVRHEVYCLPFGAGFGDDAFVGAFESAAAAPGRLHQRRPPARRPGPGEGLSVLLRDPAPRGNVG